MKNTIVNIKVESESCIIIKKYLSINNTYA